SGDLAVIDHPSVVHPAVRRVTTSPLFGAIHCMAEDDRGRLYLGREASVDRLDPASGRIESFREADGFVPSAVWTCLRDDQGRFWFATANGLSRFDPSEERHVPSPAVRVSAV